MLAKLNSQRANAYLNLGAALLNKHELRDAELAFREAIKLYSNNPKLHYNLGTAFG
jgi:cytochrome c-type biogenesis protein CcmH/NrfG